MGFASRVVLKARRKNHHKRGETRGEAKSLQSMMGLVLMGYRAIAAALEGEIQV